MMNICLSQFSYMVVNLLLGSHRSPRRPGPRLVPGAASQNGPQIISGASSSGGSESPGELSTRDPMSLSTPKETRGTGW